MAAAAISDFLNFKFLKVGPNGQEGRTTSPRQISLKSAITRPRYCDLSIFQDGGRCHLGFSKFQIFNGRTRHEWRTASLCQILSKSLEMRPRYVSFNNMLVWLQNAYSRPFWGFLGAHFPQMMSLIVLTPKGTILGLNHVSWTINRESRLRGPSWALVREKKDRTWQDRTRKKLQKGYISPICGEAPSEVMYTKICVVCDVLDVITCAK